MCYFSHFRLKTTLWTLSPWYGTCRPGSVCADCAVWSGSIHYAEAIMLVFSRDGSCVTCIDGQMSFLFLATLKRMCICLYGEQWRFWSDLVMAQVDLDVRWSQDTGCRFSYDFAHLRVTSAKFNQCLHYSLSKTKNWYVILRRFEPVFGYITAFPGYITSKTAYHRKLDFDAR